MTSRRALLTLSAAIAVVIAAAALFLAWTATTPAGLRLAARVAASLAPGLEIEAPSGTLLDRLELGRIRWTGPLREIEAKEVVLQWRPSRLLDRLLRVEQLEIGELRVASRPDGTPAQAPIDLQLPVALQVERVRIGRLGLDTLTDKGPEPGLELSAIEGRLESDGQRHTLEALRLTTARLAVEAHDTRRLKKDGIEFEASVTISPIHDMAGNVVSVGAVSRNITERKQAEEERRALE